jgi:hypothetical protein
MYVYKEVWVHPVSRWLWLMADLDGVAAAAPPERRRLKFSVTSATTAEEEGEVTITVRASGSGSHKFAIRGENLAIDRPERSVVLRAKPILIRWKARVQSTNAPWVAVIIPDDSVHGRREVHNYR